MSEIDKGMEAVVEKVRKLLNLAAKNTNEAEAASAAAKAQELLTAYNLDMSTIEQGGKESGKREEARTMGGMYVYERELWSAIAELNFCMYFTTRGKAERKGRKISFQHRIIGRTVNTTSTRAMAEYLQTTIARLARERFPLSSQYYSREAVAFREGLSDKICARLRERRRENERAEDKRRETAARAAKRSGVDTRFALTIADVKESEEIANYNFIHGENAWQKREAEKEEWNKEWAEMRAAQAKADAEAEAEYTKWAAANPEEAAKERKKAETAERAKERARSRRGGGWGRYRAPSAREQRQGSSYYDAGYEKGASVSIDPQMDTGSGTKRLK